MKKPTLQQYIDRNKTWFDHLCFYSWMVFMFLFLALAIVLALEIEVRGAVWGAWFAGSMVLVAVLRGVIYANRVKKWTIEYDEIDWN